MAIEVNEIRCFVPFFFLFLCLFGGNQRVFESCLLVFGTLTNTKPNESNVSSFVYVSTRLIIVTKLLVA